MTAISMYDASVPVFTRNLRALAGVLRKAQAFAATRKISDETLLGARLSLDMFALARQVQIACDHAKGASARLAGVENPVFADDEKTLDELLARVQKVLDFINGLDAAAIAGSEDRAIELKIGGHPMSFTGKDYLLGFAVPNFYFHYATAYAILRHNGVEIGKVDFIGRP